MKKISKAAISFGIGSCLLLLPASLIADEKKDNEIDDVIEVTAQKHPQALADIAMSVHIVDGQTVLENNLKDVVDLSGQLANLKITANAGEGTPPAINIRGVGSLDFNTSTTSPIGVYLDNVTGGSANSQLVNLFDIESIEILKGPQSTLFGRNTNGGAILLKSQRPQDTFSGYLKAMRAERQTSKLEGAINIPLTDNINTRLAFVHNEYDYSVKNLYEPAPTAGMQQYSFRLSAEGRWENLEVFTKVHSENWKGVVQPGGNNGVIKTIDPITGQPSSLCSPSEAGSHLCNDIMGFNDGSDNFYHVSVNNDVNNNSPHRTNSQGLDIHLRYQINDKHSVATISSYSELDRIHHFNCDSSPAQLCEGNQNVYTKVHSQEIRLHSELSQLYLISGLFFLEESIRQDNFVDIFRDFRALPQLSAFAAATTYDNQIDIDSISAFFHGEYSVNEKVTLTAGLRYSDESTKYQARSVINIARQEGDQIGLNIPGWNVVGDVKDDSLSGKLAFTYQVSPQLSNFVSFSRGFKSGGYNGANFSSEAEARQSSYGPETLNAYEVGSRINWDTQKVKLNLAAFYYDYQDQQVFMNRPSSSSSGQPVQVLANVGQSVIYGVEADAEWQPTSALRLQLSTGYLPKANLSEFVDAVGNEIRGNRLPYTSKWNVSGSGQYVYDLASAALIFQINFDYQSAFYFDQNQNPYTQQDGYTLFNTRIAYERPDWTISVWGKNIGNEKYNSWKFDTIGFLGTVQDIKGSARQFGIDIDYRY